MNALPPDESELETRLRAHFEAQFREQYGEELPATTLWERVEPRLHNPTTRLPMVAERALSPMRERLQGWLRTLGVVGTAREQQGEVAPFAATATQRPTRVRRIATAFAPVAAVLVIVGLAAALFLPRLLQQGFPTTGTWQIIPRLTQPGLPTPANWHDITAPAPGPFTSYAVSPDVPGLILACIGSPPGGVSASRGGPAYIWRTQDGGATWEQLSQPVFTSGCQIAPIRGEPGTFVLEDDALSQWALWVTHDQGSAWSQIPAGTPENCCGAQEDAFIMFGLLTQGVYRDGALYAAGGTYFAGSLPAGISSFSMTRDDGRTWTPLEATPDPYLGGYGVATIAADYRASGAWYRLLTAPQTVSDGILRTPDVLLEHSTNNGRTWTVISRIKMAGGIPAAPGGLNMLATTPSQPARVCVALDAQMSFGQSASSPSQVWAASDVTALAPLSPPPPVPQQVSLYGSDDGGATWHGGTVAQYANVYGGAAPPGVGIDGAGNCYVATTYILYTPNDTTTIWRLAPGAPVAQAVIQLQGSVLGYFALALSPDGSSRRLVGVANKAPEQEIDCEPNGTCINPTPVVAPRLIWTDAP